MRTSCYVNLYCRLLATEKVLRHFLMRKETIDMGELVCKHGKLALVARSHGMRVPLDVLDWYVSIRLCVCVCASISI